MKVSSDLREWLTHESDDLRDPETAARRAALVTLIESSTPDELRAMLLSEDTVILTPFGVLKKGGFGSGNWGHEGRPGLVGGSAPGGGAGRSVGAATGGLKPPAGGMGEHGAHPSGLIPRPPVPTTPDDLTTPVNEGRVLSKEEIGEVGEDHANRAYDVRLADGREVLFKPVEGEHPEYREEIDHDVTLAERESLVARVDKALGTNLVPDTVVGTVDGKVGTVMAWIQHATRNIDTDDHPNQKREIAEMGVLDAVVGNLDRHMGNYLIDESGHVKAIDNGYAMGRSLPGESSELRSFALGRIEADSIPRARQIEMADKLDALPYGQIFKGAHLPPDEIEAFHQRVQETASYLRGGRVHKLNEAFRASVW